MRIFQIKSFTLTFFFLFAVTAHSFSQGFPLWDKLPRGQFEAGFKILWKYDNSRTWGSGNRPLRISVWYPAVKSPDKHMLFERYVLAEPDDKSFSDYAESLRNYDIGDSSKSLLGMFKGSQELYSRLMKTQTGAFENAAEEEGKFPVIIYSLGQGDYNQENTVMSEFLASNGYIVIAVPQMGRSPVRSTMMLDDELCFEAQVRDLEFAVEQAYTFSNADVNKMAAVGHSMGGVYALLLAMRNKNIKLIIGLDPTFAASFPTFGYKYWNARYYDEWKLKIPVVQMYKEDDVHDFDIINKLIFSDRYLIEFPKLIHTDFSSYPMYTISTPEGSLDSFAVAHRDQRTAVDGHINICNIVLGYLNEFLNGGGPVTVNNKLIFEHKPGINSPAEEEFIEMINNKGLDESVKTYEDMKRNYPNDTLIRLKVLRRIGFEYSITNRYREAVGPYTLITLAYPSAEAFEDLGEAYMISGNKEKATENYQKALALNPNSTNAKQMLERLK